MARKTRKVLLGDVLNAMRQEWAAQAAADGPRESMADKRPDSFVRQLDAAREKLNAAGMVYRNIRANPAHNPQTLQWAKDAIKAADNELQALIDAQG